MRKRIVLAVLMLCLLPNVALAQEQHSDAAWQASYWNNMTLAGTPALQRSETVLEHDWAAGSPDGQVQADGFSARWTRYIDVAPGTYRFTAAADDGLRVYLDNVLIIDEWHDQVAHTVTTDRNISSGHHLVSVEYYENAGLASVRVAWAPAGSTTQNWRGEYYGNISLSGSPILVRDDAQITFDWGSNSPAPAQVPADGFSVRWTRDLSLAAGTYRFTLRMDDGARLWVNNHLLIDAWLDQAVRTYTGDIYLAGGVVPVKLEYYENAGNAVAQLSWTGSTQSGGVVVDDTDAGFVKGGLSSAWHTVSEGYGGRLTWTKNNDYAHPDYNWARWYPTLQPGSYEVSVYIPDRYTTTTQARYWISHAGGYALRVVDQNANGDRWVSLGTYTFRGTAQDYVSLSDVTNETRLSTLIAFDAIKWEAR